MQLTAVDFIDRLVHGGCYSRGAVGTLIFFLEYFCHDCCGNSYSSGLYSYAFWDATAGRLLAYLYFININNGSNTDAGW